MLQSNRARAATAVGAIAIVVVLFVVLNGGGDDGNDGSSGTTATQPASSATSGANGRTGPVPKRAAPPAPATIVVRNGRPVGGIKEIEVKRGEQIRFVVKSDVSDEIHVHGYDRSTEVTAGGQVRMSFPATIEGLFEVELESRSEQIAALRVNPK